MMRQLARYVVEINTEGRWQPWYAAEDAAKLEANWAMAQSRQSVLTAIRLRDRHTGAVLQAGHGTKAVVVESSADASAHVP